MEMYMSFEEGLVSIIVPVYNNERFLAKCFQSIINQSYQQIEILVVNDGSIDSSQKIIDDFSQFESRMIVMWQENQGVAAARNYALSCARGEYYLFVDSDDYIGEDYVKDLVQCAKLKNSELVICGYTLVYPQKNRFLTVLPNIYVQNEKEEWAYRISAVCSRLYSSKFWNKYDMNFISEENARAEDVPLALFANVMAKNISVINKCDYFYVQHNGSAMHSKERVLFLFPYISFSRMYCRVNKLDLVNSRLFFDIGILKFLAQFEFVLYRKASKKEKDRFHIFIYTLLKDDFNRMCQEWRRLYNNIDLPLTNKLAISLLLLRYKWFRKYELNRL